MMPGSRNMMFLNCRFESNTFIKEKFSNYYFKKCTFNNVFFIDCIFVFSSFEDCTFNNTTFRGTILCAKGTLRFKNCKLLECTFNVVRFSPIPEYEYKETVIFDNSTIINNSTFRECHFSLFKFNFDSLYSKDAKSDTKLMNLRNNIFIDCNLYGVNFDNCDLEGSKFEPRLNGNGTALINMINWFGNIFLIFDNMPFPYGENKTREFEVLCNVNNPNGFNLFLEEFQGHKLAIKKHASGYTDHFVLMEYGDYVALNIDVRNLKKPEYNINPYDYFTIYDAITQKTTYIYIVQETYMFNTNIKNCNFRQVDGFETFDFTRLKQSEEGKPDITSCDLTGVNLLNANFNGCKMLGTIFDVADVTGVDFRNSIVFLKSNPFNLYINFINNNVNND
jgi:uncharacterized protein YjbI with pentapeptide repeats